MTIEHSTIQKKRTPYIGPLPGGSLAFELSQALMEHRDTSIIICPSVAYAKELCDSVKFFTPSLPIEYFPDWETLPYDIFSPHQQLLSTRLEILSKLSRKPLCIIISINSLMHPLPPQTFIHQNTLCMSVGEMLDLEQFKVSLSDAGYHFTKQVLEPGECAFRGSIIDIFPMGSALPLRIELFDDEIESIRTFNVETQRTLEKKNQFNILPAKEFPLTNESITRFRQAWRSQFKGNPSHCSIYEAISNKRLPAGIEYYLPLFYEKTVTLFDYLQKTSTIYWLDDVITQGDVFYKDIAFRYEQRSHDVERPILPPDMLFTPPDKLKHRAKAFQEVRLCTSDPKHPNRKYATLPDLKINRKLNIPLKHLKDYCEENETKRVLVVAESMGRKEVILGLLQQASLEPTTIDNWNAFHHGNMSFALVQGALHAGFVNVDTHIITEAELFGAQLTSQKTTQGRLDPNVIIRDLSELKVGAPVVHIEHGVGRYQGLQTLNIGGEANEFVVLCYAEEDKIYVPVTTLHLISRYTGSNPEHAPLHKLGSDQWEKSRKKAEKKITDVAATLLDIYAKREAQTGFTYEKPDEQYQQFIQQFPFEETTDQINATQDIINDMLSHRHMDRLICGDVGFGKTEVAMRAAFLAVANHKQVCILVPTTLLAGQHHENFRDRFADFPIEVELLSRFRTKKETDAVLKGLESGRIDIVIGTHKLLQKKLAFKQLGLLIIDEEHRFGVKQKERIKALKSDIDILSMTATPIPRTLNLAMHGMRDISIIATPPAKRLAIKTFCYEKKSDHIMEAILRETLRGGQVFYLNNDIDTIHHTAENLRKLCPEAKIEVAHGQMRERELEKIMADFYHQRFNVLVCTTIIETGIDIPTANTILIDRADKFGLAQLHQLRGRVGRAHQQAYAYLLVPSLKSITKDAKKRLDALMSLEDLGAGFMLATHDLEIRGAGEILGEEQSGNIHAIGFSLYMELLERAVKALKSGKQPELSKPIDSGPELNLPISTIIPENYIDDVHLRLTFYKRIASASTNEALDTLQMELIDRFGLLPKSVKDLFKVTHLKLQAQKLGVYKCIIKQNFTGKIEFSESTPVQPELIIRLIQVHAKRFKLAGSNGLQVTLSPNADLLDELGKSLNLLENP